MNMKLAAKIMGKVGLVGFIGFVATFTIYMFNLENKLIYYVLRPFLNKHYDSQVRDKRIVGVLCKSHKSKPRCFGSGVFACATGTRSTEDRFAGPSVEEIAARCSARIVHQRRPMRTFASRAVFSPPYTPPEKMIEISLRLRTQTLRGFVTSQMPQGTKKPACTARGLLFARILSDLT